MARRRIPTPWTRQPQQFIRARGDVGLVHLYGIRTGSDRNLLDLCGKADGTFGAGSPTPTGVYWDYDNNGYHLKADSTGTGSLDSISVNLGVAGATSTKNISIIAKIYLNGLGQNQTIYGAGFGGFQFRVSTANKLNVLCSGTADLGSGTTSLTTGVWYWVGCSYDGSTSRFYLLGKADGTGSGSNTFSTSIAYALGNRGGPSFNEGLLDGSKFGPLATFNRVLTDSEFAKYSNDVGFWSLVQSRQLRDPLASAASGAALDGAGTGRNYGTAGLTGVAAALSAAGFGRNYGTSNLAGIAAALDGSGVSRNYGTSGLIGSATALAASGASRNSGISGLDTAIQLAASGTGRNYGSSSLDVGATLDGLGTGRNSGSVALTTSIQLAAAGTGRNYGAVDFAGGAAALTGVGTGRNSGSAGLDTGIPLAAAGAGRNGGSSGLSADAASLDAAGSGSNYGQAVLTTAIRFAAFMAGINSGISGLDVDGHDDLTGVGNGRNSGVCGLTTGIKFAATGVGRNYGTVSFAVDLYGENANYGYVFGAKRYDIIFNAQSVGYIMPATNFDIILSE